MLPLSLELTGFKGIRKGLKVNTKKFDFTNVPDGLIALVGQNGKGKSTVLQNMHPYLIMPDECKEYSPGSFSYYEECYGREACKDLHWLHYDGRMFRSLVQIDADKRKTKAYLYVKATASQAESDDLLPPEEWQVSHDTEDGNVKAYNAAIESLLGSPRMFFTNVFRGQDAKKLSDYLKSEMVDFFAELLTIEEYKDRAWGAGYIESELTAKRDAVNSELVNTMVTVNKEQQTLREKAAIEKSLADLTLDIQTAEEGLKILQDELRDVDTQFALLQEAEKKRQQTEATIIEKTAVLQELQKTRTSKKELYDAKLATLKEKQKTQQALAGKTTELMLKVAEEVRLTGELAVVQREQNDAAAALTAHSVMRQEALKKKALIEASIIEKDKLLSDLQRALQDKRTLYNSKHAEVAVKFNSAKALLAKDATLQAQDAEAKKLAAETDRLSGEIESLDTEAASLNKQIAAFGITHNEIKEKEKKLQEMQLGRKGRADCLKTSIAAAESLISALKESECTRPDKANNCKHIKNAFAAQESLPELKSSLAKAENPDPSEIALGNGIETLRQTLANAPAVEKLSKEVADRKTLTSRKQKEAEAALKPLREALKELPLVEDAKRQLPRLEQELAGILKEGKEVIADIEKQIKQADGDMLRLKAELPKDTETPVDLLARKKAADAKAEEFDKSLRNVREILKTLPLAEEAKRQLPETEKEIDSITKEGSLVISEVERQAAIVSAEIAELKAKMPPLTANRDLAEKKDSLNKSLETTNKAITLKRDEDSRMKVALGAMEGTLRLIEESKVRAIALKEKVDHLNLQISEWKLVEDRTEGIIPLEIDDAGPTIGAITNDLLMSCYGPRFTVKIITQGLMANGKDLKETFEIMVYDADYAEIEPTPLRKMSGGERVWIEESITKATCLFNTGRSGRQFLALFSDEKDGSLSEDKKLEYVAMKNKVLQLGRFRKEYFISHSVTVQERAHYIININTETKKEEPTLLKAA